MRLDRLLDPKAPGLSLPQETSKFGGVLRNAVYFLAEPVEALFGSATELDGKVDGRFEVAPHR
jgi:hypothetical protein